jgi:hypothetical protein
VNAQSSRTAWLCLSLGCATPLPHSTSMRALPAPAADIQILTLSGDESILTLREAVHQARTDHIHTLWLAVTGPTGDTQGLKLALDPPTADSQETLERAKKEVAASHYANPSVLVHSRDRIEMSAFDEVYCMPLRDGSLPLTFDRSDGDPFVALTRMARRLKLDHPGDRAVVVQTSQEILLQTFVTTLDALRDDTLTGRNRLDLFTNPIFDTTDPTP